MKKIIIAAFALASIAIAPNTYAQTKMVGGAAMYPTKNIVENAVNSKDHTTLVLLLKLPVWLKLYNLRARSPCLHQLTKLLTNCRKARLKLW
jgi:uncharacterized surface protein with fasciclin (FAS1) repeats